MRITAQLYPEVRIYTTSSVRNTVFTVSHVSNLDPLPLPALPGEMVVCTLHVRHVAHRGEHDGGEDGAGAGGAELGGIDGQAEVQGDDVAEGETL